MAIADRLNKLRTDIEDTYQAINEIGGTIPSDKNTNNIPEAIRSVYSNLPKVSDTGTNVSLSPTLKGRLGIVPKGNTYQESTTGKNKLNVPSSYSFDGNKTITTNLPAGTYYITCGKVTRGGYNDPYIVITGVGGIALYKNLNRSFTLSDAVTSVSFYSNGYNWSESQGVTSIVEDLMISTTGGDYEPYTGGQASPSPDYPQEIQSVTGTQKVVVSGKNLFDKNGELTQGWIHDNGTISGSGTYTSDYIEVQSNTNYIRTLAESNGFYDENKTFISRTFAKLLTTPSNCKYVRISMPTNNLDTEQLEKGSSKTPYQPYQEPQEVDIELSSIELNKIGDYEDYIGGTPDNWVLYKNIGKVVLNGSEEYTQYQTTSKFFTYLNDGLFADNILVKCDKYIGQLSSSGGATYDNYSCWLQPISTYKRIYFRNDNYSTANAFKQSLQSSPATVCYPLSETQQTPITEEPLVSQLNELYYLQSYNDTTNIDVTGNLPMRITASAIKGE